MIQSKMKTRIRTAFTDMLFVWRREMKMIFRDQGALIFFLLVPLAYPLLYGFIYNNEVVREVPAIVVDMSRSGLSREFVRKVDATPDVEIITRASDMEEARNLLKEGKAYGIIYVPADFSKQVMRGEQATISLFTDMSGMLYYKSLLASCTNVSLDMNSRIKIQRSGNTTSRQDELTAYPIAYEDVALFNPQVGFATFLLPAVLVLIIQQTLLLGVGLIAGTSRENNRLKEIIPISRHYMGTYRVIFGKALAYLLIYAVVAVYLLIAVPHFFGYVQLAQLSTILWFILPYIMACIFFAMACSVFIHQREACMVIYVFTSVPLLFISGISWPGSSIPSFWKVISYVFPSTFGINGFVRVNTMGAGLADVKVEWLALWIQTFVYFCITYIVYWIKVARVRRRTYEKIRQMKKKFKSTIVMLFLFGGLFTFEVSAEQLMPNPVKINVHLLVRNTAGQPHVGMILRMAGKPDEYVSNDRGEINFTFDYDKQTQQIANLYFPTDKYMSVRSLILNEETSRDTLYIDTQTDISAYKERNQTFEIRGVVCNNSGKPIPRASVSIQGTNKSVLTNDRGEFRVEADYNHPVVFRAEGMENQKYSIEYFITNPDEVKKVYMNTRNAGNIYTSAETMPEFPGGMKAYFNYLKQYQKNPSSNKSARNGVVVVQFVVEIDGSITEPTVVRKMSPEYDEEALRLIKNMPKWKPAEDHGLKIRCKYSLPVSFSFRK